MLFKNSVVLSLERYVALEGEDYLCDSNCSIPFNLKLNDAIKHGGMWATVYYMIIERRSKQNALTQLQIGLDTHALHADSGTLPYFLRLHTTCLHLAHNQSSTTYPSTLD